MISLIFGCASPPPPEPPAVDDEELLELLEYLLEFEDEDGEWVDPQEVTMPGRTDSFDYQGTINNHYVQI